MKFLVVSDIHGNTQLFDKIMLENPDINGVFFLGDGMSECELVMRKHRELLFFGVLGNCDPGRERETLSGVIEVEGFRIFYTHGDIYSVKVGFSEICSAAHRHGADIVLFGHTHIPCNEVISDLHLLNPGALGRAIDEFSYGILTLSIGKKPSFQHVIVAFDEM